MDNKESTELILFLADIIKNDFICAEEREAEKTYCPKCKISDVCGKTYRSTYNGLWMKKKKEMIFNIFKKELFD